MVYAYHSYRKLLLKPWFLIVERRFAMQGVHEFNIHTSYRTDTFLLKTQLTVNGENTQIKCVKEGSSYEESTLVYGSTISAKLWLITNSISPMGALWKTSYTCVTLLVKFWKLSLRHSTSVKLTKGVWSYTFPGPFLHRGGYIPSVCGAAAIACFHWGIQA